MSLSWPLTHVPRPDIHRDQVRLIQVGVLDLHQLQQLAKGLSLLWGDTGVPGSQGIKGTSPLV